ncbi:MAG: glycine cleavage system protein GcvH [Thermomicrobiales bacterium]
MTAPTNRKYTKTHEWAMVEGDVATIGVTDYAQKELGDITYLELPDAGDSIAAGETFGVVESVKAASDIYSPLDGEVIERNDGLIETPEVINQSPYENAWLVKVKLANPSQLDALLDPADYDTYADSQAH